ncbi:hypothetical protein ACQ4PT_011745 [Festuca glaucescens]
MRSAAGDEPGSVGTRTPALPIGEESSGRLTRSRARLLAGEKTEPTEAAQSVGDSRSKRRKVEGVSVGKNRAAEGGKRMLTAEEVVLAARPLPPEEPPYPKSGEHSDVVAWINAKDALYSNDNLGDEGSLYNILVLGRGRARVTKSVASAASMESMDGRDMIANVARSVVNPLIVPVSLFADGKVLYTTGIIIEYDEIRKRAKILSSSSFMCTKEGMLRHPDQRVLVHLSKHTVVEARVIFFNGHYGISLLDISALFTLVPASLGSGPCYGQNVSVLDREVDHALVVSRGSILCLEYPFFERNHYMFTSYFSHLVCTGGPVINNSASRIAHPIHHLKLTTVRMLDMVYRDELWSRHSIRSGFIVAEVCPNSTAEKIGIRRGDVIELIDLDHLSTVVEVVMTQLQNNSKTAGRKMPPIVSRSWCGTEVKPVVWKCKRISSSKAC